jgi:RNA polymerase sigma-70 factor (ECF subfamily)
MGSTRGDRAHGAVALADRFETYRPRLRAVAYRMLGSRAEAEDAVQEAWLRLGRVEAEGIENLGAWLTTVVSRICLDGLRSRASRREDFAGERPDDVADPRAGGDPEEEAVLVDSVGRALLVVVDRLAPAERVAFVLHDMFAIPFEEIAPVVERSPATTKKLASRARKRVRGTPDIDPATLTRHRRVVDAFLAAARAGDVEAVLAVLAPDVVRRADTVAVAPGRPTEVRGARTVAEEIAVFGAGARFAATAMVDGDVGLLIAPAGRLRLALTFRVEDDRVAAYELIADPARLASLELAVL